MRRTVQCHHRKIYSKSNVYSNDICQQNAVTAIVGMSLAMHVALCFSRLTWVHSLSQVERWLVRVWASNGFLPLQHTDIRLFSHDGLGYMFLRRRVEKLMWVYMEWVDIEVSNTFCFNTGFNMNFWQTTNSLCIYKHIFNCLSKRQKSRFVKPELKLKICKGENQMFHLTDQMQ